MVWPSAHLAASLSLQALISAAGSSQGRTLSRREILDRYEQHTRHCPSCRRVSCARLELRRRALPARGAPCARALLPLRQLASICALFRPSRCASRRQQPSSHRRSRTPSTCPQQALATVQVTRQALQLAAATGYTSAFALVLLQALLPGPPLGGTHAGRAVSLPVLVGSAALAAGLGAAALLRLEQRFVFVDYVHAGK